MLCRQIDALMRVMMLLFLTRSKIGEKEGL